MNLQEIPAFTQFLLGSHLYDDPARGGDFAEQLSSLILSKILLFKSKFAFLDHWGVASSKS